MGPVENNINLLVAELKNNRKVDKDHALDYLGHVFRTIIANNVPRDERWGASMTVNDFLKKARGGDFRRAEGYFGNWAKHSEELDQDVGC